ncbi:hypothetical protein BDR07DRAFT_1447788 [Suillus spraguei]|nr:hypothetical protein BDR07DRAFT_1447788 [Suillus spraguei]
MPVETRSATHAPSTSSSRSPSGPRRQRRMKKSEDEDTVAQKTEVKVEPEVGERREAPESETAKETEAKKPKTEEADTDSKYTFIPGVIERGHIYFFYRPKVQREEVHSMDDISKLHVLLVPSSSESFSVQGKSEQSKDVSVADADKMNLVAQGADAAPPPESTTTDKKHFRLIIVGKKRLPDPEHEKHAPIWATVIFVGDNLHDLEKKLEGRNYETKTRGTRHTPPVRLAGRGVYAIVNCLGNVPSRNATHLGYHLSHPTEFGDNPKAEAQTGQRVGLSKSRRTIYSEAVMKHVFGRGEKGRSSIGLRFTNYHEGAELLLIPARTGTEGNDQSLGNGRGEALEEASRCESEENVEQIFKELAFNKDHFPAEPLKGEWT